MSFANWSSLSYYEKAIVTGTHELLKATLTYGAKNGGLPNLSPRDCARRVATLPALPGPARWAKKRREMPQDFPQKSQWMSRHALSKLYRTHTDVIDRWLEELTA